VSLNISFFLLTISRIDIKHRVFIRDFFLARDRLYLTRRSKFAERLLAKGKPLKFVSAEAYSMKCTFRKVCVIAQVWIVTRVIVAAANLYSVKIARFRALKKHRYATVARREFLACPIHGENFLSKKISWCKILMLNSNFKRQIWIISICLWILSVFDVSVSKTFLSFSSDFIRRILTISLIANLIIFFYTIY